MIMDVLQPVAYETARSDKLHVLAALCQVPTSHRRAVRDSLTGPVYVSSMSDPEDEHNQLVVVDLVDDAVVARAHPPLAGPAYKLGCLGRSGVGRQQVDGCLNPTANLWIELT